jgi:ADP-ribose pyrophosphatase
VPEPTVLFQGSRFRVERLIQTTPDGVEHVKEVVKHPGAVTLLPLLDDGRICLVQEYRVSVGQTLIELPAGTLEPGEDPAVAARRELAEETGYRAGRIEHLATFYMSPGVLDERMVLYVATALEPGPMDLDAGEDIRPLLTTWPEALAMVADGRIRDAKSMLGLLYYQAYGNEPALPRGEGRG